MFRGCVLGCLLLLAGCGVESPREAARRGSADGGASRLEGGLSTEATPSEGTESGNVAGINRKIIYEAEVQLVVTDFHATEEVMPRLVKEYGGYLAQVRVDRTSGRNRSGNWQARIPVQQFDAFIDALTSLGVPESRSQTAQDVTEEYVDLEARIANKQRLEKRILELLEKSEGKISDVIEVERELARVRGEIEQMEGRLRYLVNRTELTTVVVFAREERDYVPPQAPTFPARVGRAWGDSLVSLRNVGEGLGVAAVFAVPWLVVLSVVALPVLLFRRIWRTRSAAHPADDRGHSPAASDQADD